MTFENYLWWVCDLSKRVLDFLPALTGDGNNPRAGDKFGVAKPITVDTSSAYRDVHLGQVRHKFDGLRLLMIGSSAGGRPVSFGAAALNAHTTFATSSPVDAKMDGTWQPPWN